MMKKGITCGSEYDKAGTWMLAVGKARGKLTLEEIKEASALWENDIYLLVIDCRENTYQGGFGDFDNNPGDSVTLYRADELNKHMREADLLSEIKMAALRLIPKTCDEHCHMQVNAKECKDCPLMALQALIRKDVSALM